MDMLWICCGHAMDMLWICCCTFDERRVKKATYGSVQIVFLWVVTPCSLLGTIYQCSGNMLLLSLGLKCVG
jgi:hypothetical protein